jgi:hypothetical protein
VNNCQSHVLLSAGEGKLPLDPQARQP